MTTGVRGCTNRSNGAASIINVENPSDSRVAVANSDTNVYAWISQHKDRPLSVQTIRGRMIIWDSNWKILGQWDNNPEEILLAAVEHQPQDYRLLIAADGNISLQKI